MPFDPRLHALSSGEYPLTFDCCICRARTCNPFPGYWERGVCSRACSDEKEWREALAIVKRRYQLQHPLPPEDAR